jgi:hypothetical protein
MGGAGERTLETRHVIGLFILMLLFSGVFFTVGYVMGRNQFDGLVRAATSALLVKEPPVPKGAFTLEVAAVGHENDALNLAQALQRMKFAVYILLPGQDTYYHVQIGPYADVQSATTACRDLEAKGFKCTVKKTVP